MAPTREQLIANIKAMESQGAPQQDIQSYLDSFKGQQPPSDTTQTQQKSSGVLFPSSPTDTGLEAGKKALGNLPGSIYNAGKSLFEAGSHPIQTLKGLGSVALGGVEKLIPGQQGNEQSFDAVVDSFKQRYGSLEALQKTATEDPFGFGSDVVALFSGIGGALKGGLRAGTIDATRATEAAKIATETVPKTGLAKAAQAYKDFSFPKWFGDTFQKSSLNLTAAQKATFSDKLGDVASFLNKEKAIGTPEMKFRKMEKLTEQKYEPQIQKTLQANKNIEVRVSKLQDDIRSLKQDFFNDNDFEAISRRVDSVADSLNRYNVSKNIEGGIPLDALNQLKRSTFKNAFNSAGDKVTDVLEFAIADKYYDNLIDAFKTNNIKVNGIDLETFNKTYKTAIEAKKILNIARKRPLAGLVSRLTAAGLGVYFGSMFGGPVGAIVGPGVAQFGAKGLGAISQFAKGAAGKAASVAGKANVAVPTAVGAGTVSGANALTPEQDYIKQLGY